MLMKEELLRGAPFAELKASDGSTKIRIYTYRYEFPEIKSGDDADWHMNYISLSIGEISAKVDAPIIEGRVLEYLLKEVIAFSELKTLVVDFSFTEPEFSFTMSKESLSDESITILGEIIDNKLGKSSVDVKFQFKTDSKLVDSFINGIKFILKEYPPRY